jgi:hypothetical protein
MPVIPARYEEEIEGLWSEASLGKNVSKRPHLEKQAEHVGVCL